MNPELPVSFPHTSPEGYSYESSQFKSNVVAIWIRNHYRFVYNGGETALSIWGFYNTKTKCFHSPVNSKTVGDKVELNRTTPYSAVQIKQTPLEKAFL
jgi:hypothetical protein